MPSLPAEEGSFANFFQFFAHKSRFRTVDTAPGSVAAGRVAGEGCRGCGRFGSSFLRVSTRFWTDQPPFGYRQLARLRPGNLRFMIDLAQRIAGLEPHRRSLLQQRLQQARSIFEPLAIVGMGCRFPGAPSLNAFWQLIRNGQRAVSPVPSQRWDNRSLFHPTAGAGRLNVDCGGFLENVDQFDASFFGVAPREASKMDPQQRLLLEVTWEALEHAGMAPERTAGSKTGVFIGIGAADYAKVPMLMDDYYGQIDAHCGTGNALSIAANRISYLFDWHGPSLIVDTACSSSLVALHTAAKHLHSGEADVAICGGANLILTPETTIAFSNARMLSPDGHCRPFDARANGYVRGEGVGVVVLKRLADAVAGGDRLLGVIRGTAVNQDGRTSGIAAPSSRSQEAVIRQALSVAGLTPEDISYVEAHGTGTPLGDPIEMAALIKVFGGNGETAPPCRFSSVKANIGHLETAAGIASLIKVLLMMGHRQYVAQTDFNELNPHVSLTGQRLQVSRDVAAWDVGDLPRRAGISSFGFGGTNAHVVVEEAITPGAVTEDTNGAVVMKSPRPSTERLLAVSAKSATALRTIIERYTDYLAAHPETDLEAFCRSANCGRNHFSHRLAISATDTADLRAKLMEVVRGVDPIGQHHGFESPKVAFLFTGQGGQYAGMGESLLREQPVFAQVLRRCDEVLAEELGVSIIRIMHDLSAPDRVSETRFTQPALFALEYSLAVLWRSWGVEPTVMLGHSVGEYVAATLAGVFSLEDGLRLIAKRASLMHGSPGDGAMAAVALPADVVSERLVGLERSLSIAACNGPANTVISGDRRALQDICSRFESEGVRVTQLKVTHAFHSPLMDPILDEFERFAGTIHSHPPNRPVISNLTGQPMVGAPDAAYWRQHLRSPVRFEQGLRCLIAQGAEHIVEVGPAPVLLGMGRRIVDLKSLHWLPSLRAGQPDGRVILSSLAHLYQHGAKVRWDNGYGKPAGPPLDLPTYPFERKRHWYQPTGHIAPSPGQAAAGAHPLLGVEVTTSIGGRMFDNQWTPDRPDYLNEHRVQGSVVTPAAAYVELGLAAADSLFGPGRHRVRDLSIQQAMFLPPGSPLRVQVVIAEDRSDSRPFKVLSRAADAPADATWNLHACGTLVRETSVADGASAETDLPSPTLASPPPASSGGEAEIDAGLFYDSMKQRGFDYGPRFRVLRDLRHDNGRAWARVEIDGAVRLESERHRIHPAILDGCLQAIAGVVPGSVADRESKRTYLPSGIESVRLLGDPTTATEIRVVRRPTRDDDPALETIEADIALLDADGNWVAEVIGAQVRSLGARADGEGDSGNCLHRLRWEPSPSATAQPADATTAGGAETTRGGEPTDDRLTGNLWVVVSDHRQAGEGAPADATADELIGRLRSQSARCIDLRLGDHFRAIDEDTFVVDPQRPEDFERAFAEFGNRGDARCDGVVDLTSLAPRQPSQSADADGLSESLDAPPTRDDWVGTLHTLRQLSRSRFAKSPPVWICTRGAQPVRSDVDGRPRFSILWGLGRAANLEYPGGVALLDLDPASPTVPAVDQLIGELLGGDSETQVAFRAGDRYVARLVSADATDDEAEQQGTEITHALTLPQPPFRLRLKGTGSFDQLDLAPFQPIPPQGDQVQIRVHATGLNFSDVLKAMGLYPGLTDREPPMGIECSGVVTAVGPGVTRFQVGEEVMGVVPYGFASHAVTAEFALVRKPAGLTHAEAATVPITYLTAHHALVSLARLQPGERVLIHAAAGGVGLAAIQIAQSIGATVFATAGSDVKRDYLRSLGVEHVYSSRGTEFAGQIREETGGEGVDVVLNSLPGEAIPKSLALLSAYGRFLEIGKTDIYQDRMIGLAPFKDNLSYFAIDLDRILRQRPTEITRLFAEVMSRFETGAYAALPLTEFPISQTATAFRYMAQRKNIGKVVVTFDEIAEAAGGSEKDPAAPSDAAIRPGVGYLITGGLGALGLRVARWLVDAGADHLVLMSRSLPSPQQTAAIAELTDRAQVVCLRADVADAASLRESLQTLPADWPQIVGVIHAAGALADGLLYDMPADRFATPLAAKVDGAWNLHQATRDLPLDFFVMFSSIASIFGSPGQTNYAAANAFLDALAARRRSEGLPAATINWGPWAEGGMATDGQADGQVGSRGMRLLAPERALSGLRRLLESAPNRDFVVSDIDWDTLAGQFPKGCPPLFTHFANHWQAGGGATQDSVDHVFLLRIRSADAAERQRLLTAYLAEELGRILGTEAQDLETSQPLTVVGVDSLMAMELKANLESRLGIDMPMAFLMDGPSLESLAANLLPLVSDAPAVGSTDSAATSDPQSAATDGAETDGVAAKERRARGISLLPLQTHAVTPSVFCLHPVGGDLRCYQQLAVHLGRHRQVMTIRPRGLDAAGRPHGEVPEMAEDYCRLIREFQPEGPYLLLGWSTGGIFAYEMSRQLVEAGQDVQLIFLDTPTGEILDHVDLQDDARFLFDLVNFSNWFSGASIRISYEELRLRSPSDALELILTETKRHGVLPAAATRADLEQRIELCRRHLRAAMDYRPQPLDRPVIMYRPRQTAVLALATGRQLTDDLGWAPILGDNLQIRRVSGDHFSMLTGEHARRLADEIIDQI